MLSLVVKPCSSGNQYVYATIVVVVRLDHVQTTGNAFQSYLVGNVGKSPVAIIAEILRLLLETHMRDHYVEMTVVGEILNDDTTRSAEGDKSSPGCNVAKFADVIVRSECIRWDEPLLRHAVSVGAEHHVRDIEKPSIDKCILRIA